MDVRKIWRLDFRVVTFDLLILPLFSLIIRETQSQWGRHFTLSNMIDGLSDETPNLLNKYISHKYRLRYIHNRLR